MGDFAEFICDDCGRFRITGTALEAARLEQDQAVRRAALEKAKQQAAKDKSIPKITSYDF
ncbi:hypothetical protein ACU8MB_08885 [Rhizobium leguminosarum]